MDRKFDCARAALLYEAGQTRGQIGLALGVSKATVYVWLKTAGVAMRSACKAINPLWTKAAALYEAGQTTNQVGATLGVSGATAYDWLRKAGVVMRPNGQPINPLWTKAAALYEEGKTTKQVGEALGVPQETAGNWLKKAGVVKRPKGHRKLAPALESILSLYASGMPATKIGAQLGVSREAIRWRLVQAGISMRTSANARRQPDLREDAFDTITEESAYWAGFLMADGCVVKERNGQRAVCLGLAAVDTEHVQAFKKFLNSDNALYAIPGKRMIGPLGTEIFSGPQVRIKVYSNRLADGLARFGVVPRKSLTAEAHLLEDNPHFWRGVIDGDGTVCISKSPFRYMAPMLSLVGSQRVVEQFRDFVVRRYGREVGHFGKHKSIWTFRVSCRCARAIIRLLYGDCAVALARKLAKAREILATQDSATRARERYTRDRARRIVTLYEQGNGIGIIAAQMKTCAKAVKRALLANDVALRSHADAIALGTEAARTARGIIKDSQIPLPFGC